MRRCVWSRDLKNEEAMARVGPQRHGGGGIILVINQLDAQNFVLQ